MGCDTFTLPLTSKTPAFIPKRAFSPLSPQPPQKHDVCLLVRLHHLARCSQPRGLSPESLQHSADLQTSMKAFCEEECHFCEPPELPVLFRTGVNAAEVHSGL